MSTTKTAPFPAIPEEPSSKPRKVDSDTQTNVSAVTKQTTARQIQGNLVSASMPQLRFASAQNQQKVNPSLHMRSPGHVRSPKSPPGA